MRTTFQMVLNSRIPEILNIGPTDVRCAAFINEATQRLLYRGKYWGTFGRFTVAVSSQLMTLPAQIDTIEAVAVSRVPLPLHDSFWEFLQNGWGTRDSTLPNGSGVSEVLYRGNFPTFVDVPAGGSTLTVKCDVALDSGKTVVILGYDTNNNWVRTQVAGVWQDGEIVALAQGAGTNSVTVFSKVTDVQPPPSLSGQWWLYAGGIAGTLLSNYQWYETSPSYKRFLIPFINTTVTTVEIVGKLAFYPVQNPSDYLVIGNIAALKLACRAIKAEEESDWATANLLWNGGTDKKTGIKYIGALQELDFELDHQTGSGRQIGITVQGSGEPLPELV